MQHTSQAHQPATSQPAAQREAQPGSGSLSAQLAQSPRQAAQRRQLQDLRAGPAQRAEGLEEEDEAGAAQLRALDPVQRQENRTGMPDSLKAGIESLSGMDMSDVRVHRNSSQPAQLNALAYAQGNDIHLGPGQEQHLPHEAWHVVQQRQERVQVTRQMAGVGVNDDEGLEREADVMGGRAVQLRGAGAQTHERQEKQDLPPNPALMQRRRLDAGFSQSVRQPIVQRMMGFEFQALSQTYHKKSMPKKTPDNKEAIGKLPGSIEIERDGKNPEFITPPYHESMEPEQVQEALKVIPDEYQYAIELIAQDSKNPAVTMDKPANDIPTFDAQTTGGFKLSEIVDWYKDIAEMSQDKQSPFAAKEDKRSKGNVERLRNGLKTKSREYPSWYVGIKKQAESAAAPVQGLMLLVQNNIDAIAAAAKDAYAPGVKTLSALLPKTNLSALYRGLSEEDRRKFEEINDAIHERTSHGWHAPVKFLKPLKEGQLKWEYVQRWVFYPHLYMIDVINGVEPAWVFEGFSEIDDEPLREGMYQEVEETHGEEAKDSLARDRTATNDKWKGKVNPRAEVILEMRDVGNNKLPLGKIPTWGEDVFRIYKKFKASHE